MTKQPLTFLQLAFILLLSIGLLNHVIIIPVLLDISHRDSWLTVLVTVLLFVPVFCMIGFIMKRSGTDKPLLERIRTRYGSWLTVPVSFVVMLILFASAYVTGKDMTTWINSSFLPETPPVVIIVTFVGSTYYLASKGLRAIAYSSAILLPLVVLFGEFVMTFNFPRKDYQALLPLFEYGAAPMWHGVLYVGTGMLEMIFLIFMNQHLVRPAKLRSFVILGFLLSGLTIGPVMGALAAFGPVEGSLLRFPAFEEWRIVKIGYYVEHVDFLSIFQWLSGAFIRIGLSLYLISDLSGRLKRWNLGIASLLLAACISIKFSDELFLQWLKIYYFPILFFTLFGVLLLLYVLVLILPQKGGRQSNAS